VSGFRGFLAAAEAAGLLRRVGGRVDPGFEPGCFVKWMYQGLPEARRFGFLFTDVAGAAMPLATAVLGASPASYALALGVGPAATNDRWEQALLAPRPVRPVGTAPCQEVVHSGAAADLSRLPIPVWTPGRDAGPYITTVTVNRGTGHGREYQNQGVYRTQVRDPRHVIVNLAPGRQGHGLASSWLDQGRPAPIAWVIGAEPAVYLAAVANLPPGVDELTVAGGLLGHPVDVVKAVTSDLLVPANAEIIIEGEVLPGQLAMEGPFGESAGYMSEPGLRPVARITAITHRRDPVYYGLASQMPPSESTTLQSLSNAALIRKLLRHDWGEPGVRDCWIDTMFGGGAAHLVVSLQTTGPGHARHVGRLLAERTPLKRITLVDADIDVGDRTDLDWVMSSHFDPARDTEIIGGFPAPMDHAVTPDADGRKLGSKLVIDATRSLATGPVSLPPAALMERARAAWDTAGLPDPGAAERLWRRLGRPAGP
jgi:4-hydroxy-3-polyprenylbenzoate decarboxylase